jgi:8-oxo-dGTP diphosphatase
MSEMRKTFPKVGVAAILTRANEVLLIRRQNAHGAGSWAVPGGHLEFGESIEHCAAREVLEEVGVQVTAMRYYGITNDVFALEMHHYITVWMAVLAFEGEARVNAPAEMTEIGWFRWDALPKPLFIPFKNFIDGMSLPSEAYKELLTQMS